MKKLLKIFISMFSLITIFASCANSVGGTTSEITTSNTNGIVLKILDVPEADRMSIKRRNLTKGEEYYSYDIWQNSNENKKEITDYFVTKDNDYEYVIEYRDRDQVDENGSWLLLQRDEIVIKAIGGLGELDSLTRPSATYDENSSIMTFSTLPTFSSDIENFVNQKGSLSFHIAYFSKGYGCVMNPPISEKVNCATAISDWNNEKFYGKPLHFGGITAQAYINGVSYEKRLSITEGIPNNITVNDTREKTTVKQNANGIEITLPTKVEGMNRYVISRKDVASGKVEGWYINIDLRNSNNKNKTSVIDYFVEKGKSYQYKVECTNQNGKVLSSTSYSDSITATNGVLELAFNKDTTVTYDENTTIMTFNPNPDFTSLKKNLKDKGIESTDINVYCSYNPKGEWCNIEGHLDSGTGTINWSSTVQSYEERWGNYFDQPLDFYRLEINCNVNDVFYRTNIEGDLISSTIPTLPTSITVKDTRVKTTVKQNTNGIEIILPTKVDGINSYAISRKDVASGKVEDWYIDIDLSKSNNTNRTSVIDYFVEKGKSYQYKVGCRDQDGNVILATKYSDSIVAENGVSELAFNKNTTVTYDENTTIMTFNPKPDFTSQTEKLKSISGVTVNDISGWCSYNPKGEWLNIEGHLDFATGTINWSSAVQRQGNYFDQPLDFDSLGIFCNINDVFYRTNIGKDLISSTIKNFPTTITVTKV